MRRPAPPAATRTPSAEVARVPARRRLRALAERERALRSGEMATWGIRSGDGILLLVLGTLFELGAATVESEEEMLLASL